MKTNIQWYLVINIINYYENCKMIEDFSVQFSPFLLTHERFVKTYRTSCTISIRCCKCFQATKFFNCSMLLTKCWQYDKTNYCRGYSCWHVATNLPSQEFEFHWVQHWYNAVSPCPSLSEIDCCNIFSNMSANTLHLAI